MIILHCLRKSTWDKYKSQKFYGEDYIKTEGFIHCSDISTFHKVAPNFKGIADKLLLLCIETDRVEADIKWEDGDNCGTAYPHIYGLLNIDAIVNVLDYLMDSEGEFVLNPELIDIL